ncbi:putative histidine acid phosphatase protein [Zalerion maritima]|uniref:Histidine acid phosphatase protein n=1 Tax=Zalerion maritima TaxID=339359 RepID=A0AAD5WQS3_9PEZI|nr:putative histidine acid phosphatase protein [Zalerion maritima]
MALKNFLFALATAPLASAETILGVYMLHRHGDRTSKSYKPVNLTALGADQVYDSGNYYRQRYVESGADAKILDLSSDIVIPSQITVQSPIDSVLQISAQAFLQSLYPPVGDLAVQELANGSEFSYPFDGYQYIPVNTDAASNDHSENNEWLQSGSGCGNALVSSNSYFFSESYKELYSETQDLYQGILPVINGTFGAEEASFKNGYTIWDLINVALIHNKTISSEELLTESTMTELKTLADTHEWNLAYNASSEIRAIAGKVLAGQVLTHLNNAISSASAKPRFGIQFGAYATFFSFFGLADLPSASSDFKGIVKYASSMAFELFTDADPVSESSWPAEEDVKVRFIFANGTASSSNEPQIFPLFGLNEGEISWTKFVSEMQKFAIINDEQWCGACGNTTGSCAAYVNTVGGSSAEDDDDDSKSGLSVPVAGVVGALVALGVILGVEALVMVFGGIRLVKKGVGATENKIAA